MLRPPTKDDPNWRNELNWIVPVPEKTRHKSIKTYQRRKVQRTTFYARDTEPVAIKHPLIQPESLVLKKETDPLFKNTTHPGRRRKKQQQKRVLSHPAKMLLWSWGVVALVLLFITLINLHH